MTLDHHLGWGGSFSRGPRVGVYRDGSVVFAKRAEGDIEAKYFRGMLTADELQQVNAALQRSYVVMNKDIHLAPGWHDLPRITLSARYLNQPKTVTVEGFQLDGHFAPPKTDKKKRPDPLPMEIDRAAKMLMYLDPKDAQPWQPDLYEIRLSTSLHEIPQQVHSWPDNWPDLKSKSTSELRHGRRDSVEYSILLTAAQHEQFLELEKKGQYFKVTEKTLFAYHWLPVLPDSTRWRAYQRSSK